MSEDYTADLESVFYPAKSANFFARSPRSESALCAELSRLVYVKGEEGGTKKETVENALAEVGFDSVFLFSDEGTQGFFARGDKTAVLVFRGTETGDPTDLNTNTKAWQQPWQGGGSVHQGFAEAFAACQSSLESAVTSAVGDGLRLVITGHSLGAALATLAASLWRPSALYTYGSPRVGDGEFSAGLADIPSQRYINCCDLVCKIPPSGLYKHVGRRFYINRSRHVLIEPSSIYMTEDQVSARSEYFLRRTFTWGNAAVRDLADHAPINYVQALFKRDEEAS